MTYIHSSDCLMVPNSSQMPSISAPRPHGTRWRWTSAWCCNRHVRVSHERVQLTLVLEQGVLVTQTNARQIMMRS